MLRYLAKRAITYVFMIFLTTSAGYLLAVSTLQPALLEQERIPRPTPEQVVNSFRLKGLDPTLNPWERYVDWLTGIVTRWDWGGAPTAPSSTPSSATGSGSQPGSSWPRSS